MNWYKAKNSNDTQGLVIDETTGENIAVTYKVENAALVAAAPELAAALEVALEIIESYRIEQGTSAGNWELSARAALKKAGR